MSMLHVAAVSKLFPSALMETESVEVVEQILVSFISRLRILIDISRNTVWSVFRIGICSNQLNELYKVTMDSGSIPYTQNLLFAQSVILHL